MNKVERLIQKGATIPDPKRVSIADEVNDDRLAGQGVVIYPGVTLRGEQTCISEGAQLGREAPVTVEDCYIGPEVSLKGGYFSGAVFLKKASCGLGAHVRQGTILEEEASIAHTVGLKQTILFPFVTLGSLINFCDCLMAGGTDRHNHSEVGSSYIHFNFTPNQDKATPSLIGDVPRGVMMNHSPIFLGGQGGLVGPCRITFGTTLAAGTLCRTDQLKENHLVFGSESRSGSIPYKPGGYFGLSRIIKNNLYYLASLYALRQWYLNVRCLFIGPHLPNDIYEGLNKTLLVAIAERIKQLEKLKEKLKIAHEADGQGLPYQLITLWPDIMSIFQTMENHTGSRELAERFIPMVEGKIAYVGSNYIDVIKNLTDDEADLGTQWLESIVQKGYSESMDLLKD